ncbi:MAG: hypothetical protein RBR38_08310 [Desulfomicrobium apsheronum]|nr:hypothetical protein [Desulfomicrobium apsheronum]
MNGLTNEKSKIRRNFVVKCFFSSVIILFAIVTFPFSSTAFMGYGGCMDKCDGDPQCIKDCREMYKSEKDAHEEYKKDFRECFNSCYDLRGKEKENCLEKCRGDYKFGRDLPKK